MEEATPPLVPHGPHLPLERRGGCVDLGIDSNQNCLQLVKRGDNEPELGSDEQRHASPQGQVGLQNLGNTCYMNSVLQCLTHEPEFFAFFGDARRLREDVDRGVANGKELKEKSITHSFAAFFREYWSAKWAELEPREFKSRVGDVCTQFDNYQQHDGQEFLAALLDCIHEELSDLAKSAPLPQLASLVSSEAAMGDSPDSAFLSAGSSSGTSGASEQAQLSPENGRVRKRANSDEAEKNAPSSPDSSGSVNLELTKLSVSKRPRLTSECTLESENPSELWRRYMETNESFISRSFQGQFASELTCATCAHSSKTYEPFMYLTLPVPNPPRPTFTIGYVSQALNGLIKVAVEVEKNAKIAHLIKVAIERLEQDENKQIAVDTLKLYEFDGKRITRLLDNEWTCAFIQSASELLLIETLSVLEQQPAKDGETNEQSKAPPTCDICKCEEEGLLHHQGCVFRICPTCLERNTFDPNMCPHCKCVINGFVPVDAKVAPDDWSAAVATHSSIDLESTITCTISFRDFTDQIISLPCALRISKSINSAKIYEQLTVLLYGVCESPEFDLYYANQTGDSCSRCTGPSQCSGCRVPENFDVELKRYDNFKVVTNAQLDRLHITTGRSQRAYELNRPTLAKCLDEFRKPEQLEENNVYCQKCKGHTGAEKKVTVQRWPETLIVYLKRFVYLSTPHPHAKKIETEVIFDHQNLDVSNLSSDLSRHHYDLVGSIQHFGGIHSGHYTAYASDPVDHSSWTYFNDQTTSTQRPSERDAKSVYILFYRRQNSLLPTPELKETLRQEPLSPLVEHRPIHRTSPVLQSNNMISLTHDDISEQLRKKLQGSVSSLESLKAEGGGSARSSAESLNLDDFQDDTEFHQTPIPSPDLLH